MEEFAERLQASIDLFLSDMTKAESLFFIMMIAAEQQLLE